MTILYYNEFVDYDEYVEENQNGDQLLILNLIYKFYHTTNNRPNRLEKRLRQKIKGTETILIRFILYLHLHILSTTPSCYDGKEKKLVN